MQISNTILRCLYTLNSTDNKYSAHSAAGSFALETDALNLKGVLRLETSRMKGFPARNVVTMSSCSSCRWNRGAEEAAERDIVTRRGVMGENEGYVWRVLR